MIEGRLIYNVKFYGYPVKVINAKNYYEITGELARLITIYKCPPEWMVRQS